MFVYHHLDDPRALADELVRHDGLAVRSNQVLRLGRAAEAIVDASRAEDTDLVVLSGARLSGAPSVIVKDVLERSTVAIVLLGRSPATSRSRITRVAL
jgi:nucleotide-binding universal stress UspA family protein